MNNQPEALRLADALEQGTYLLSRDRNATATCLRRQHAEIASLKAERDALRADAERYQWLRDTCVEDCEPEHLIVMRRMLFFSWASPSWKEGKRLSAVSLDTAIDAARAALKEAGK